jgi:hypothetical protein
MPSALVMVGCAACSFFLGNTFSKKTLAPRLRTIELPVRRIWTRKRGRMPFPFLISALSIFLSLRLVSGTGMMQIQEPRPLMRSKTRMGCVKGITHNLFVYNNIHHLHRTNQVKTEARIILYFCFTGQFRPNSIDT